MKEYPMPYISADVNVNETDNSSLTQNPPFGALEELLEKYQREGH